MLVDSGAKVSLLNSKFINRLRQRPHLTQSPVQLTTYTGSPVDVLGIVNLNASFQKRRVQRFPFQVVRNGNNLMGIDLFDALGFSINTPDTHEILAIQQRPATHQLVSKYPEIFEAKPGKTIKNFIHKPNIDHSVPLVVEPMRRVPQMLQEKAIGELKQMEANGILVKVDSAPCVSNMVIAPKPNDQIRICGDLRNSNKAIIPDRYPLPTMEELSEFFAGATVFSKLDLKWGYLQVNLHEDCRYLTTMITPIGLYQWTKVSRSAIAKVKFSINFTDLEQVLVCLSDFGFE